MKDVPNPGSLIAIELGCTCPVWDNHYGEGFPTDREGSIGFVISMDCPLHAKGPEDEDVCA